MKTLYIECNMGAAGDMLTAALAELTGDVKAAEANLNSLGIPGITYSLTPSVKCGITGTHSDVEVFGEHEHSHDAGAHEHSHSHEHEHSHHGDGQHGREQEHHHEHSHEDAHVHSHEHDHGDGHEPHHHSDDANGNTHKHSHEHHHHHTSMHDIEHIISALPIDDKTKTDAIAVYKLIADAESKAHGRPVEEIHFHEVGAMDAVADVVAVCVLINELNPDQIVVSPVHVGSGEVKCAHGILPVPAPATAHILQGVPSYGGKVRGELCTPTGAALLKHFATSFGDMPVMSVGKIGYGMGCKDFEQANCVRVMIGESAIDAASSAVSAAPLSPNKDRIAELRCNLDDMTGEEIGYATGKLLECGALDVFTTPIGMKKNRPGILLSCLCRIEDEEKFAGLIFEHTTTLGIRVIEEDRFILSRREETVSTKFRDVRVKISEGFGVTKVKPGFDDVAAITDEE